MESGAANMHERTNMETPSPYDKLLDGLRRTGIRFVEGDTALVAGRRRLPENAAETYDVGTCCGDRMKVGFVAGDRYRAERRLLTIGQRIAEGTTEPYGIGEIRCYRRGAQLCIAYFEGDQQHSIELACTTPQQSADEGWFTFFGPVTSVNTAWSDNDPSTVEVVTLERLRRYARARGRT